MIQYLKPIRNNSLQPFKTTYYDQNGVVIDLTNYASVYLVLKLQGEVYITLSADFISPRTLGQVQSSLPYSHTELGIWDAQFFCVDGAGNLLPSDIVQYRVVANIPDLALTQLPVY